MDVSRDGARFRGASCWAASLVLPRGHWSRRFRAWRREKGLSAPPTVPASAPPLPRHSQGGAAPASLLGAPTSAQGVRAADVTPSRVPVGQVTGSSRAPLGQLTGTITPSDLHFERHHAGVPALDAASHQLLIHGLVERPMTFSVDDIRRLPQVTRTHFVECSGNGRAPFKSPKPDTTAQAAAGMSSNTEWTGVPLATLFREVGVKPEAKWFLAEGADACHMTRSVPIEKAWDDAMVVWAQNGEPLRPAQGYPLRLLLPGFEGNINVKWLRRLELGTEPWMTRWETSVYTDPLLGDKARQFSLVLDVKSVITTPSHPDTLASARVAPDHRSRLVGSWTNHARGGEHRRRHELARGAADGDAAAQGTRALPVHVELAGRSGHAPQPRHRRDRAGATDALGADRGARAGNGLPLHGNRRVVGPARRRDLLPRGDVMRRLALCLAAALLAAGCNGPSAGRSSADASAEHLPPATFATYDAGAVPGGPGAQAHYGLGAAAPDSLIARWNSDIGPEGAELPPGKGSVAEGEALYATACASCHGVGGVGGIAPNPTLVGRDSAAEGFRFASNPALTKTIGNYWPYATTLFDYIRRAMPQATPGTLTDDQVYALTAYLLAANQVIPTSTTLDAAALREVKMPYRDRFVRDDRPGGPGVH